MEQKTDKTALTANISVLSNGYAHPIQDFLDTVHVIN